MVAQTFAKVNQYWMIQLSRNPFELEPEYLKRKKTFCWQIMPVVLEATMTKSVAETLAGEIVQKLGFHVNVVEVIEMQAL